MKTALLLTTLLLAATFQAQSQTVWRCGADGRSYADSACPEGRPVAVADARSAAEVQAARDVLAHDQALARQLAAERHERDREARAAGSGLASLSPAPRPEPQPKLVKARPVPKKSKLSKPPKKHPPAADGTWQAVALGSR